MNPPPDPEQRSRAQREPFDAAAKGLDWLAAHQLPSGELAAHASPLGEGVEPDWQPDSLKFITALIALACDEIDDPRARSVTDRAVEFLLSEREGPALWRYWTRTNDLFDYTPPDADDTACCSMAVNTRGHQTSENTSVLVANRDPHGRFYTWLIPHRGVRSPRYLWTVRDEFRKATKARRAELWANSEAWPDDVDGVVNANVIRYLGTESPPAAVEWVASLIESNQEDDCDSWHRNRYTLYASIADAARKGVRRFEELAPMIIERIDSKVDTHGSVGPPLDTALALVALQRFDGPSELQVRLAESLVHRQLEDGSWERSVFYYGGPDEVFGWASEALTTATAVLALWRLGASVR